MPRERPRVVPFEPTWLARSLDRYLVVGLAFMVVLVVGFVAYRVREPSLRADATREQRTEYIRIGRQLFGTNCAECHGERGTGGSDAPTLNSKEFLDTTTDDQAHHVIAAGISGTEMSAWSLDFGGNLTDEQVREIVTYMRSWQPGAPSVPDWRDSGTASERPADHDGDQHGTGDH